MSSETYAVAKSYDVAKTETKLYLIMTPTTTTGYYTGERIEYKQTSTIYYDPIITIQTQVKFPPVIPICTILIWLRAMFKCNLRKPMPLNIIPPEHLRHFELIVKSFLKMIYAPKHLLLLSIHILCMEIIIHDVSNA